MQLRYKRLGKNTFLVFLGKAGSSIIGLLMLPFYTHWLSTNEYGTVDLITTYSSILMGIMTCCIADSIFIFPKESDDNGKTRYFTSGLVYEVIASFCVGIIFLLLQYLSDCYSLRGVFFERIWFVLAFAICQFLQQYSQSFTQSLDKMKVFSITGILYTLAIALFSFILIPRYGLNGYLFAMIYANILATFFTVIASRSYKYLSISGYDREHLVRLLRYGLPLIPNGLMWWLVNGLNRPVMESSLGLDALGLYAVANKFPGLLSTMVGIFGTAWNITMLEEFGKPDFNRFFNRTVKMLFFLMIICGCVISACSKLIVTLFADPTYFDAWKYIPVLTLGVVFQYFSGIVGGVFMAEKKSKYFFYSSIWGAITSLIATIICIKFWGLQGAAIAVSLSFFVMAVARLVYAWKHINEMRLSWYILVTLLYIIFIVLVLADNSLLLNIPLYLVILGIVFFMSRDIIAPLLGMMKSRFNI